MHTIDRGPFGGWALPITTERAITNKRISVDRSRVIKGSARARPTTKPASRAQPHTACPHCYSQRLPPTIPVASLFGGPVGRRTARPHRGKGLHHHDERRGASACLFSDLLVCLSRETDIHNYSPYHLVVEMDKSMIMSKHTTRQHALRRHIQVRLNSYPSYY